MPSSLKQEYSCDILWIGMHSQLSKFSKLLLVLLSIFIRKKGTKYCHCILLRHNYNAFNDNILNSRNNLFFSHPKLSVTTQTFTGCEIVREMRA